MPVHIQLVATLIVNPQNPVLTSDIANSAQTALNATTLHWLENAVACDIYLPQELDHDEALNRVKAVIGNCPIDCVVQAQENRRKKLLLADMDSTMIQQECIDELAEEVGLRDHIATITKRAMNGEIDFEPALRERVALLKGLSIDVIDRVIEKRITLMPGGRELIATMKANHAYTALVSGGFTLFTKVIAQKLGFDENHANQLHHESGKLSGTVEDPILGKQAKLEKLNTLCHKLGISTDQAMAVGDGANDLAMLQAAGAGVALHAKPVVAEAAKMRIDHGDLTALLYIQGYQKRDFICA